MNAHTSPQLYSMLKTVAAIAAGTVCLVGCLVLTGWAFDLEIVKRVFPHSVAMNPLTAIGFFLAGLSLALWIPEQDRRTQRTAQAIGGLVTLLGLLKLSDLALAHGWSLDDILFREKLNADLLFPNRMAPTTAASFFLAGLALWCVDVETRRRLRPAQFLALSVSSIALLAVVGHLYGVQSLTGLEFYIPMAFPTALAFLALAVGLLCLRPDRGFMARVTSGSTGGVLIRRTALAVLLIPVLLGWLMAAGVHSGRYDPAFAFAIFVVLILAVFSLMVWISAVILDRKEAARNQAVEAVRRRSAELTRANTELEQARQAAEAASRAKSTFLANMSHEIRTPLNGVIGMTELVLKSSLSLQQREFLMTVKDSGEALLSVINDILDFSKIEAGKLALDTATFDFRESLGDTMKAFALRAHQKNLELACFIRPDVPRIVVGDYNRIRQIVVNLVGNAIKFTETGEVSLEVSQQARSQRYVVLHLVVRDTGIGVPEEKRSKIFEMFEQADGSTTRRHGGTGLGLAIAVRLVALMDGRIWVESEAGRGSQFHFTIRLELGEDEPAERAAREPACLHGLRVFIVDDNATNRRILEETLRSWNMVPASAASAPEAIELLRRASAAGEPFRLMITDAHMPDCDGFMLAEQIQRDSAIGSTVIMMLTSGDRPEDLSRCNELGLAAYLLKPVKQSELLEAIELALGVTLPKQELLAEDAQHEHLSNLRILLAEDSLVNQKVALAMLEGKGHAVTLVTNGKEAVAASSQQKFDIVLMDVQMPEMDGLEATAQIRAREQQTGNRLPIIAMTAHALKGDRERCLTAGMDGYVSKPIRPAELFGAINTIFSNSKPISGEKTTPPAAACKDAVNWEKALETAQGDRNLLKAISEAALEEFPQRIADLRRAIADGNPAELRLAAHTLKGSLRYFGAASASDQAAKLEAMGQKCQISDCEPILTGLEAEITQVTAALAEHLDSKN
jgi:two-component system, sensor histidine kinase and response regulator